MGNPFHPASADIAVLIARACRLRPACRKASRICARFSQATMPRAATSRRRKRTECRPGSAGCCDDLRPPHIPHAPARVARPPLAAVTRFRAAAANSGSTASASPRTAQTACRRSSPMPLNASASVRRQGEALLDLRRAGRTQAQLFAVAHPCSPIFNGLRSKHENDWRKGAAVRDRRNF